LSLRNYTKVTVEHPTSLDLKAILVQLIDATTQQTIPNAVLAVTLYN